MTTTATLSFNFQLFFGWFWPRRTKGQWAAFEDMLAAKKTLSIAVSNFDADQLSCITQNKSATVPAVNQLSYSVGSGDPGIAANAAAGGILVQAYSPLGGASDLLFFSRCFS